MVNTNIFVHYTCHLILGVIGTGFHVGRVKNVCIILISNLKISQSFVCSRVTRTSEDNDLESTLPITSPNQGPKRGDTTFNDDEDNLTSGDGNQSGDGPDPVESGRPLSGIINNVLDTTIPVTITTTTTTTVAPTTTTTTTTTTPTTTTTTEPTTLTTTTTPELTITETSENTQGPSTSTRQYNGDDQITTSKCFNIFHTLSNECTYILYRLYT